MPKKYLNRAGLPAPAGDSRLVEGFAAESRHVGEFVGESRLWGIKSAATAADWAVFVFVPVERKRV
ncbi:hypothetical protein DPQ22_06355 [Candidatus Tokpelaia sp.]|nr:hypothetical protein DPQ22_06355 [Candidatus Tokpelaia sp.]